MDAIEEIRNASEAVSDDSNMALARLFGEDAQRVKKALIHDMGALVAGQFTLGMVVGAQLIEARVERQRAEEDEK